jgi:SnoaL-like domain
MDPTTFRGPIAPESPAVTADRVAVCRLAPTYAFGIDARDEALVRSVFAPDAVLRGALGEAPADQYIPRLLEGVAAFAATMHNITNQYAVVDGDEADVWSYAVAIHLVHADSGRDDLTMGVQYRDHARRVEDGWLVAHRETIKLWDRLTRPR